VHGLDCEVFPGTLTTRALDAARSGVLASPWTWLGALLVAVALAALGHSSAEAAGDDGSRTDQPGLLASVVATADEVGGVAPASAPVTAPVTGALRQVPEVDVLAEQSLLPVVAPLTGGQPLVRAAVAPLRPALTAVSGALPAPVDGVAHDVVATLPDTAQPAPAAPAAEQPAALTAPAALAPAASLAVPARVWREQPQLMANPPASPALSRQAPAGSTPSNPPTPWSPGLPPLAPGAPGAGGLAALTAGLAASVAWAAALTLLVALVVLARARMTAPLALRSAMHASRMRRPG
jgi:hypothetical protein